MKTPRRYAAILIIALAAMSWLPACVSYGTSPPATTLIELDECIPDILLDIRYATPNNFTGKVVYPDARCFLNRNAAFALAKVQEDLKEQGYRLKIFDGYRPLAVQRIFWEILPDPRYVADPEIGSRHNSGYAVDATLVKLDGSEVVMPTEFDDFSERAHSDYMDLPEEAIRHRALLHDAMKRHGFTPFATEWWHFDYQGDEEEPLSRNREILFSDILC
jgi:D-alanyl-D-alanine dipeptidase